MVDSAPELRQPRFEVEATMGTRFFWFRTRLTLEQVMMSWVHTAITLIGFGFTIVLVFEQVGRFTGAGPPSLLTPVHFGLLLIGAGVAALVVSGWQYRAVLHYLRHSDFAAVAGVSQKPAHTPAYAITIITIFVGVFAFFAVVTRAL
jgi:putative membrane protein